MNGRTSAGKRSEAEALPGAAESTCTVGVASSMVSCCKDWRCSQRGTIPATSKIKSSRTASHAQRPSFGGANSGSEAGEILRSNEFIYLCGNGFRLRGGFGLGRSGNGRRGFLAMDQAEDNRHEKQRRHRGHHEAANHGAAQRGILLAAFAEAEAHG